MSTVSETIQSTTGSIALDSYVVWHSPAGHHGLHGPYPHDIAQQLVRHAPGPASVVVVSVGATAHYRFLEVLLTYGAAAKAAPAKVTALLAAGVVHAGTQHRTAVTVALGHILGQLADDTDPAAVATALVEAGFTPLR